MSEPNRAPSSVWMLRPPGPDDAYPNGHVRTAGGDRIEIAYRESLGRVGVVGVIHLSRKDARLLAKRINQCLDDTRKR